MMLRKVKYKDRGKSRSPSTFTTNSGGNPHSARKTLHSKSTYFYRWGSRLNYVVPGVCGLALLVGGVIAISPKLNGSNQAYAEGNEDIGLQSSTPTLSLDLAGAASQQTSAKAGSVAYRNNIFTVTASNISQYTVTLNTVNGDTGELAGRNNPYAVVGKVSANTAPANFADNTWGYSITTNTSDNIGESLTYNPVPSGTSGAGNSVKLVSKNYLSYPSSLKTIADSYNLFFAAKLGNNMPADHYEAKIYLSVVASPAIAAGLTGNGQTITNMQDMTSTICQGAEIGHTSRLFDIRDGKDYWVAKLADGNCWMTQNLDLDLDTSTALTAADSDVYNWTPSENTKTGELSNWSSGTTAIQSWDPGDYYYKLPGDLSVWSSCNTAPSMSDCVAAEQSNWTTSVPVDGGRHYHVGNYYSWNTATAGTGGSITSGQAASSICPRGWKLPTSGSDTSTGSFYYLMNRSGVSGSNANDRIRQNPLYFIPAGQTGSGGISGAGQYGYYWSSTPKSDGTGAFILLFSSGRVDDSWSNGYIYRYNGYPVRCVAK